MFYRTQAENKASLLRHVLPAIFIIGVAIVMLVFVVGGMLAPMVNLIEGLSGGKR